MSSAPPGAWLRSDRCRACRPPETSRPRRRRRPLARARKIAERLAEAYPGTATELCALVHDNPFELLVATILSAQCTDERVNLVTPALFARYPDAAGHGGRGPRRARGR